MLSLHDIIARRQTNRILRLTFPHDDGPAAQLLPQRLHATEALSRDFEYTVELLSDDASLALKDLMGRLMCVELVRDDGSLRHFTGHVFAFRLVRTDGAVAFYEAVLAPWLAYLKLRRDNYLFHGKTLRQQTESIFEDYGALPSWDCRVAGEDPPMTDACQFDESDHNYLHRRWEAAGWSYWYEHGATGHKLVLCDDTTATPAVDGACAVPFQRHGGAVEEDGIGEWSPARRLVESAVAIAGFDFKQPVAKYAQVPTLNRQGDVHPVESYEYAGAYPFPDLAHADRTARLRMEEAEAAGKHFAGAGNCRRLQPGRWFELTGHFDDPYDGDRNAFLVVEVVHEATNNYLHARSDAPAVAEYRNHIRCLRRSIPWRPGRGRNSVETRIAGPQTAIVVGPDGPDSIHTDGYGRIRVQFHWDRAGNSDERSSAWVRVASPWSGGELGVAAVPRVGSEVIVQWLGGSPDRPIVTGTVFNETHMPPWSLPAQHALTGLRSRELAPGGGNLPGGRSNHLVLDDTHERIQAQLKSDHAHSQLSLGHIARIEDNAGRKDVRGEGFELATEAWGTLRAGKGLLVTTELRRQAAGHTKDMGETVARLGAGAELHRQLADDAGHQQAQAAGTDQSDVAAAVRTQNDAIRGGGAQDEFTAPHLVLSSPAGIAASTPESTHLQSGAHVAATAGGHIALAAGKSLFASVAEKISLFVSKAGMKLFAARGKVEIQAQSDNIEVIAEQVLKLISTKANIEITAAREIVLNAGGSYLRINAQGIEHGTDGTWIAHAGAHKLEGPKNLDAVNQAEFERVQPRKFSQQVFVDPALWDLPSGARTLKYTFLSRTGQALGSGTLDGAGTSKPLFTDGSEPAHVTIDVNDGKWEQLVFDRPEGVHVPDDAPQVVFDYDHEPEDEDDTSIEESNDSTLA
ncbi:type VI secretion system Vgr family protein [Massilia luteola]|uniref:type VI secretion system Vgr family protein n=1 Tax=Massilia luteola TaxID=3081751 RepID=UPI002ACBFDB8|nr:type VI secretion system Vgr family protein [Massilia sp. Gc5]